MHSPIARYVLRTYFTVFTILFALFAAISFETLLQSGITDLFLLPLSIVSTISACAVLLDLASRHEIETLQCYGVGVRDAAMPFAVASLATQAIGFAFLGIPHFPHSLAIFALCLASSLVALLIILKNSWRRRDKAVVRACIAGVLAQVLLISAGVFCLKALL